MAYINLISSSETSLRVNVDGLDSTYNGATRYVYWSLNGISKGTVTLKNLVSSGGAYTFSGLSAGTRYQVQCKITIANEAWEVELSDYFYTDEPTIVKPDKWSWNTTNGPTYNATAAQTRAAYSAVTGKLATNKFPYQVWNDLCDKALELQTYVGQGWDSAYASQAETKMSASSKTLTATRFNSLRRNVYTGWSAVKKGDKVSGSYFTQIANQINSWIDYL